MRVCVSTKNLFMHTLMHSHVQIQHNARLYRKLVRKHRFACVSNVVRPVPTDSNRRQTNTKHQKYFDSNKVPIGFSRQTAKPPCRRHQRSPLIRSSRQALSLCELPHRSAFITLFFTVNLHRLLLSEQPIIRFLTTLCITKAGFIHALR